MNKQNIFAMGILFIVPLLLGGCDSVSESKVDGKKIESGEIDSVITGTWRRAGQEIEYLVFGDSGQFTLISVDNDTATFPGKFSIIDSMIHATLYQNSVATEEVWLRLNYLKDSILLYKGILFNGASSKLVGEWEIESTVQDSLGLLNLYKYRFLDDGLLIQIGPGYADTSKYSFTNSLVTVFDKENGKVKMNLGYEIQNGRLSIYNLDTKKKYYRVQ